MTGPILHRRAFRAMGSPCEIQLFAPSTAIVAAVADRAIAEVERLEALYSRYRPESLLSEINRVAATGGEIAVDAETASLLDYAAACHAQSGGLFDISSGILRRAWRFDQGKLPDPDLIAALMPHVGWEKLRWRSPLLVFPAPGMEIDFGGVVKEYAVDRLATLCRDAGLTNGVINLGGDIRVIGPRGDGSPWSVGIRHHRSKNGVAATLKLERGAIASSGDYERCMIVDGKHYGHILNPRTGWPVQGLASVSVVADFCLVAGSAATIAMLKEDEGIAWLEAMGLPHLWGDLQGRSGGTLSPELGNKSC